MIARQAAVVGMIFTSLTLTSFAQTEPFQTDRVPNSNRQVVTAALAKRLYESMTPLTYPERAMLYSSQRVELQMALWQYHFGEFARLAPDLTAAQRNVLARFSALAQNPEWFRVREGDEGWQQKHEQLEALRLRGLEVFSSQEFFDGFMRLGPPYVARSGAPDVPFVGTQNCHCSTYSDWCPTAGEGRCLYGADILACIPTAFGCGTFGTYSCDGLCF